MRRALMALATVLVVASSGSARADSPPPNLLLVNVGDLFGGAVNVEYERALGPWFGLTAGLSVWAFHGVFSPPLEATFTGLSPELGARFHFVRDAPGGLWVGPYLTAGYLFSRSDGALTQPWAWGLGAAAGYNFIFGSHFTFQLGVGGGFTDYGDHLLWAPRLRLGVGAAF